MYLKIKKPLAGFDRGYVRGEYKWIRIENVKFLKKQSVLYGLKNNKKKCFNKNCQFDIKITKGIDNSKFFDYQSIVSNDFFQKDGSNKCFKRNKGKVCKKAYALT